MTTFSEGKNEPRMTIVGIEKAEMGVCHVPTDGSVGDTS